MSPFNRQAFGELLCQGLDERLNFDQLVQYSDPKRIARSATVRGPSLQLDALQDGFSYFFNFKSTPSTTGLRQRGYIRFFKPANPNTPLEKVECEVGCTCPDYKFAWAWANKQRGSGRVGPDSVSKTWNQAPRITNPRNVPGLCKHLLTLREYIYGKYSEWNWEGLDTPGKLDKLVKYSHQRTIRGDTLAKQQAYQANRRGQVTQDTPRTGEEPPGEPAEGPEDDEGPGPTQPPRHRGPNLGGIQAQLPDSVVRVMDVQPILDDLRLVEAEVKDAELLKLLREFFSLFRKLGDAVEEPEEKEGDEDAAKLDLPDNAEPIDPMSGNSLENSGNDKDEDEDKAEDFGDTE